MRCPVFLNCSDFLAAYTVSQCCKSEISKQLSIAFKHILDLVLSVDKCHGGEEIWLKTSEVWALKKLKYAQYVNFYYIFNNISRLDT